MIRYNDKENYKPHDLQYCTANIYLMNYYDKMPELSDVENLTSKATIL